MSAGVVSLWRAGVLEPRDECDVLPVEVEAADSWLVTDGTALAIDLHHGRFLSAVSRGRHRQVDVQAFWDAAVAAIPREGDWFPRVELRNRLGGPELLFRLRESPPRSRAITLATHRGRDPRTAPGIKGPDLERMVRLRTEAQREGADEAVILTPEGWIAEGSTTGLVWWRGDALCLPSPEIERIDSVTVRSVVALATAMGAEIVHEAATPDDLEGLEVWALNALHGIRIVTRWTDGPTTAELPGRVGRWRRGLEALRRPLPAGSQTEAAS